MDNKKKTRNLSVAEYFLVIQREYLIAEFRKKNLFQQSRQVILSKSDGWEA